MVLLTGSIIAVTLTRHDDTTPPARTLPAESPSPSPTPCRPKIVDSGFWNNRDPYGKKVVPAKDGRIDYGAIVENPCGRTASHVTLDAYAFDAHGRQLIDGFTAPYDVPPGHRLAIPGVIQNEPDYDASKVTRVEMSIDYSYLEWSGGVGVQGISADQIEIGKYNKKKRTYPVRFRIKFQHPNDTLNDEGICVILRDSAGAIVSAELSIAPGDPRSGSVVRTFTPGPMKDVDPSRTEVYFLQPSDG